MFGKTLFLSLGLIAAVTLGCEKKEEAPAVDTDAAQTAVEEHTDAAHDAAHDAAGEAAEGAEAAVEDAAEAVEEAADEVKDAAGKIEIPGQ